MARQSKNASKCGRLEQKRACAPGSHAGVLSNARDRPAIGSEWLSIAGRASRATRRCRMSRPAGCNVAQWADDNCHLYLWTTNNFITRACKLMAHWGFAHKPVLTWVKPRWGLGSYFRNSTEHVLFGVRLSPSWHAVDIGCIALDGAAGGRPSRKLSDLHVRPITALIITLNLAYFLSRCFVWSEWQGLNLRPPRPKRAAPCRRSLNYL